jgi:positive regulator of sigma E activity
MLTKTAIVVKTDGRIAQVTTVRPTACNCCAGTCHERCHTIEILDTIGMHEGDEVELVSSEQALALTCAVMFLAPAALFVAMLAWSGIAVAALIMLLYFFAAHRLVNGPLAKALAPRAVRIIPRDGTATDASCGRF